MNSTIISNAKWGDALWELALEVHDEQILTYQPGQFYMLSVGAAGKDPLLKRPLAPYSVDIKNRIITFIYAVVGRGTQILADQPIGRALSISTPHGNGFTINAGATVALVAGGVGVSPMHSLAQALVAQKCNVTLFYGGRSKNLLYPKLINGVNTGFELVLATEDGSAGSKGFVTTLLQERLSNTKYDIAYTCGPKPMMKAVHDICAKNALPLEVSLEERMACGIGVCYGCMVDVKTDDGEAKRVRCCTEGPVFNADKVAW